MLKYAGLLGLAVSLSACHSDEQRSAKVMKEVKSNQLAAEGTHYGAPTLSSPTIMVIEKNTLPPKSYPTVTVTNNHSPVVPSQIDSSEVIIEDMHHHRHHQHDDATTTAPAAASMHYGAPTPTETPTVPAAASMHYGPPAPAATPSEPAAESMHYGPPAPAEKKLQKDSTDEKKPESVTTTSNGGDTAK